MIKTDELRAMLTDYLGHNEYTVTKYSKKRDGKQGYNVVVYGKESRKMPVYAEFAGLTVHLLHDKAQDHWFSGEAQGFRTYELV